MTASGPAALHPLTCALWDVGSKDWPRAPDAMAVQIMGDGSVGRGEESDDETLAADSWWGTGVLYRLLPGCRRIYPDLCVGGFTRDLLGSTEGDRADASVAEAMAFLFCLYELSRLSPDYGRVGAGDCIVIVDRTSLLTTLFKWLYGKEGAVPGGAGHGPGLGGRPRPGLQQAFVLIVEALLRLLDPSRSAFRRIVVRHKIYYGLGKTWPPDALAKRGRLGQPGSQQVTWDPKASDRRRAGCLLMHYAHQILSGPQIGLVIEAHIALRDRELLAKPAEPDTSPGEVKLG